MKVLNIQYNFIYALYILFIIINVARGSIFDYVPFANSFFQNDEGKTENSDGALQKVLYEVEVPEEKFLEQASLYTGVALSELDKCQHRVIFKLQQECHKLNDEELAKLAVKLLNCQSDIEGRKIYPCTDQMPIRDCTSSMDPDTWNSYLLMSNRARAVCYSIRQAQFRGLTEMTVNKLMNAAHDQLGIMNRIQKGQSRIEKAATDTISTVVKGHDALKRQQNDMRQAQLYGQLALEDNIRRLADEKQLILDGHEQLTKMTREVQIKLEDAAKQLDDQTEERKENHKEILNDLIEIQMQAQAIFQRIEESSQHMLQQSALAAKQYEATLSQLVQMNSTVYSLVDLVTATRSTLEEKLKWLSDALGGTDDAVERLYLFVTHALYLVLAMVSCAFLQVPIPSRVALIILVPLNLLLALQQGAVTSLNFPGLSAVLVSFIAGQALLSWSLCQWHRRSSKKLPIENAENKKWNASSTAASPLVRQENENLEEADTQSEDDVVNSTLSDSFSYTNGSSYKPFYNSGGSYKRFQTETDYYGDEFVSPTPPLSRQSRSRSKTPQYNGLEKRKCSAATRQGTPCKSFASVGRDYCYRHQTGSSIIQ